MELYIKVSFWIGAVALVLRLLLMCVATYPRQQEYSLGSDVAAVILQIGFGVWAGILLFA